MTLKTSNIATLPTKHGTFNIQAFQEGVKEHLAIFKETPQDNLIVRIHSECLTGDALGSLKCDCGEQLNYALELIAREGGMLIYMRQEGRNIGLLNKVNAYALQDQGFDTVQANHHLGFEADLRTYEVAEEILHFYNIQNIQLLTNNPQKLSALKQINITQRIPIIINSNSYNEDYLQVKKDDMGHLL